jgi:predicted transcriptional regulator
VHHSQEKMSDTSSRTQVLSLMAQIVSAHVSHNAVRSDALPGLIQTVYATLASVGAEPVQPEKQQPAVPIKRSVFPDYIVCLEDGKKLKMLKRHLQTSYGMTPEQYRERWGLSADYPMVAPNYAERRSDLAKKIGLGRKRAAPEVVEAPPPPPPPAAPAAKPGRGRKAAAKAEAE